MSCAATSRTTDAQRAARLDTLNASPEWRGGSLWSAWHLQGTQIRQKHKDGAILFLSMGKIVAIRPTSCPDKRSVITYFGGADIEAARKWCEEGYQCIPS